jgi:hypothetical protein
MVSKEDNYYEILGVSKGATLEEIKRLSSICRLGVIFNLFEII